MTSDVNAVLKLVRREKLTYLSPAKLGVLVAACRTALASDESGQVIEAGSAMGGSAILLACVKDPGIALDLYDTFDGIPEPGPGDGDDARQRFDEIASGSSTGIRGDTYYGYVTDLDDVVRSNFERLGFPVESHNVRLNKGDLRDLLTSDGPSIAFAHLDVDWFESTLHALGAVWSRLTADGQIVVDDYGYWSGCTRAVDEFCDVTSTARLIDTGLGSAILQRR